MRQRRRIKSGTCYEICFRARAGLPLAVYRVIHLLLGAALARTQRDNKVDLSHDIWEGSHPHLFTVAYDAEKCVRFYAELQKRITDAIKRLLNVPYLNIWEGRPLVSEIGDLDAAIDRIAYLYANPAQDNLVESIDKFPGYSSWKDFKKCPNLLNAEAVHSYPWIRNPSIPALSSPVLTPEQDARLVALLRKRNREQEMLIRKPNAWMKCFGIKSEQEVAEVNKRIIQRLREKEKEAGLKREQEKKSVMGAAKLRRQPIMKPHTPKKRERKVFIITTVKELRIAAIEEFKRFCDECRRCYQAWRSGDFGVEWPLGAFKPPLPPNVNILPGY